MLCDVLQESGPLRKKFKINNCIIEQKDSEKDKELGTPLQVHESNAVSNHMDNTTGVINVGHFKEPLTNCIESNSRLDEEKKPSKALSQG